MVFAMLLIPLRNVSTVFSLCCWSVSLLTPLHSQTLSYEVLRHSMHHAARRSGTFWHNKPAGSSVDPPPATALMEGLDPGWVGWEEAGCDQQRLFLPMEMAHSLPRIQPHHLFFPLLHKKCHNFALGQGHHYWSLCRRNTWRSWKVLCSPTSCISTASLHACRQDVEWSGGIGSPRDPLQKTYERRLL